MYFQETTNLLFTKLPTTLSKEIEQEFKAKYLGLTAAVIPTIHFIYSFVQEMCVKAALQKELRDFSICSTIPILGNYKNDKKYGIRKSRSYKGKPHDTHIKVFKKKYQYDRGRVRKCKCFVCGMEGHFARDCRNKKKDLSRAAKLQELDLPEDWDIVSADNDDSSVYSISEGEQGLTTQNIKNMVESIPQESVFMMRQEKYYSEDEENYYENEYILDQYGYMFSFNNLISQIPQIEKGAGSWRPEIKLEETMKNCSHEWKHNEGTNHVFCYFCKINTTNISRTH